MSQNVLLVDDDPVLTATLGRAFTRRGFKVYISHSTEHALRVAPRFKPDFAVVDLRMDGASGLDCVAGLRDLTPSMRIVVLTGYASIATAVGAIQSGACHYLAKPVQVNDILSAFSRNEGSLDVPIPTEKTTLKDLEWERINRTMMETNYNISETARRLRIGRRNLQRKLNLASE